MAKKENLESLVVDEDDMMTIVAISKAIIAYSKNKSVGALIKELEEIELVAKDIDGGIEKLLWHQPTLGCVKTVHKKFSNRIKQLKKAGRI